jgi:hypothetical protein
VAAALLVTWFLLRGGDGQPVPSDVSRPDAPAREGHPRRAEEASVAVPPPAGAGATPPADVRGSLRVRVVSRADGTPLPGAEVWSLLETERSLAEGWALLASRLHDAPVLAGADGWAYVPWGEAEGLRRVVARAGGFAAAEERVASREVAVVLALAQGLAVSGRVVDARGAPVPHLPLEARAAARPRGAEELPMPGGEVSRGESDGHGEFTLVGLAEGPCQVRPAPGSGWVAVVDLPSTTTRPHPGAAGALARAGSAGLVLVVEQASRTRLRLVDRRTGEAPAASHASVTFRPPPPAAALTVPFDDAAEADVLLRGALAGADVPFEVRARGYRTTRGTARTEPAGDAEPSAATVVELEPEDPTARSRLVVDVRRELPVHVRPGQRVLTWCREVDAARTYLRGRDLGDGRAAFDGLPAGAGVGEVWDGVSRSLPFRAVLPDGGSAEAKAEFPTASGATFALRSQSGLRVYDADLLVVAPQGRLRGLPNLASATRLEAGGEVLLPLSPGVHRFAVQKRGVGYAAGTFVVEAGRVTGVVATLGSQEPYLAATRAAEGR